ncbi:sigma-54-dependent Fis family transcriptional regulator [Pseudonocardia abyssalis]|uniref:Fis family transcriptional regulator n=1 Tax=Pseudonocardia abyssalis TaxID=2792008 RepID=A0ABS6UVM6_9PSEU|nr:helix-turn-helix domain-containing protein [Pseudonocardia abyssalis]MBW0114759.1 Fis family transcriptional regulator [Pseudonocardia abyssalis]MBW0136299.1 Fis family transcriptional regulator [Pseudonocardia abyssalis]
MSDSADRRYLLAVARANFLEGAGEPVRSGVPDHVLASWRRSVSRGVQPSVVESPYSTELDLGSRLVRCAQPVLDQLVEQVADIPMCVALTDGRARLLMRKDSSPSFGRVTDRVCFAQGFGYAEEAVGTNGVGTVLEYGQSVHIVGPEHFVDTLQSFACAGAPIRDPFTGRIEGVLDISCFADHSSPILHSMVKAAAARIERNLLGDRNQGHQALFDLYSRVDARSREAVLAVGPTLVMANTRLQAALDASDRDGLESHVRFLMRRPATIDDRIDLPSGVRVRFRASTVAVGDEVAGMVGVVTVLPEVAGTAFPHRAGRPATPGNESLRSPRPRTVESSSPSLRTASSTVADAVEHGHAVLVLGEPGSGRCALLREQFGRRHPAGESVEILPDELAAAPRDAASRILGGPAGSVLHICRDIDRVPAAAVTTFLDRLAGAGDDIPLFAATSAEPSRSDGLHPTLLTLFGTSATVPPLRHRGADLPALTTFLLSELAPHRDVHLTREAQRIVAAYHWPGNVQQLRSALVDALRVRPVGAIDVADLPAYCQSAPRQPLRPVDEAERDAIVAALRDAGGNRKASAAALGLARSTLYRKIHQYGITD